jgi:hypothetical protein
MPLTSDTKVDIPPIPVPKEDTTGYILTVKRVSKDGGDYVVKCPHCGEIIGVQGDDLSEVRGEQYQHKKREYQGPRGMKTVGCDGWLEVSHNAVFVKEL